jgi:hypothetical protein
MATLARGPVCVVVGDAVGAGDENSVPPPTSVLGPVIP